MSRFWRDHLGRYRVGDYVTRDGTDLYRVVMMHGPYATQTTVKCVAPPDDGAHQVGELVLSSTDDFRPDPWRDLALVLSSTHDARHHSHDAA